MENIIDSIVQHSQTKSKYRKWASLLFTSSIILNALLILFSLTYISEVNLKEILSLHAFLGLITFSIGLTIIYFGLKIKEDKTYQYSVSIWGLLLSILPIFAIIMYF